MNATLSARWPSAKWPASAWQPLRPARKSSAGPEPPVLQAAAPSAQSHKLLRAHDQPHVVAGFIGSSNLHFGGGGNDRLVEQAPIRNGANNDIASATRPPASLAALSVCPWEVLNTKVLNTYPVRGCRTRRLATTPSPKPVLHGFGRPLTKGAAESNSKSKFRRVARFPRGWTA